MLPHCERGQERKGLELRRGQRPDQARPSRQQEEFGFYLKGNGKPLKGLKWSSDNDLITFPEGSQPTVGSMNWRDQEQKEKGHSRGWCHGALGQHVSCGDGGEECNVLRHVWR